MILDVDDADDTHWGVLHIHDEVERVHEIAAEDRVFVTEAEGSEPRGRSVNSRSARFARSSMVSLTISFRSSSVRSSIPAT